MAHKKVKKHEKSFLLRFWRSIGQNDRLDIGHQMYFEKIDFGPFGAIPGHFSGQNDQNDRSALENTLRVLRFFYFSGLIRFISRVAGKTLISPTSGPKS